MEATECGAASLAMVLAFHGAHLPLSVIRSACNVGREGSRASDLLRAGRSYGLTSKGWRATSTGLKGLQLPAILFWNHHHFVVLEAWGERCAWLNDPALGHRCASEQEMDISFSGVALTFSPGPEFKRQEIRAEGLYWALRQFCKEREVAIHLLFGASLSALLPLITAGCIRIFIDEYYLQGEYHWLPVLLNILTGVAVLQVSLTLYLRKVLQRWETREAQRESRNVLRCMMALPAQEYLARGATELAARLTLPVENARLLYRKIGGWLLYGPMTILALLWISLCGGRLAIIGLPSLAIGFGIALACKQTSKDQRTGAGIRRAIFANTIFRGFSIPQALGFGRYKEFLRRLESQWLRIVYDDRSIALDVINTHLLSHIFNTFAFTGILAFGVWDILEDHLSIGTLAVFLIFWTQCNRWLQKIFEIRHQLNLLARNQDRLADLPPVPTSGCRSEENPSFEHLEMRGVTFGYAGSSRPLLNNLNVTLSPGRQVALVGPHGSGKSTLARLLVGLLEPTLGEVLLNGEPITPERFSKVGGRSETPVAFAASLAKDHLWRGNESISLDQAQAALAKAGVSLALAERRLPLGAENLSTGERRLLEMARLFARTPSVVILDDPTAEVGKAQALALAERWRKQGCAVIWITCNSDLIKKADEIWFLNTGTLTVFSSYDALLVKEESLPKLMTT